MSRLTGPHWIPLALSLSLAGCFYVPNLKKTVDPSKIQQIEVGRTTLDDAIDQFGEANARVGDRLFVYELERTRGWAVLAGGYSAAATRAGLRRVRLLLEFDTEGVLSRFDLETNLEKYEDFEDVEEPDRGLPSDRAVSARGCEGDGPIHAVRHEGSRVLTGHLEGHVCTWDGSMLAGPRVEKPFVLHPKDRGAVRWRSVEPDLVEYYYDEAMAKRLLDGLAGLAARGSAGPILIPELWPVALSADGTELATSDERGRITRWDVATSRPTQMLTAGPRDEWSDAPKLYGKPLRVPVGALAFAPRGRLLAASWTAGPTVLFDLEGDRRVELTGHAGKSTVERRALAFSSDGRLLAVGGCLHVELWRVGPAIEGAVPIDDEEGAVQSPETALETSLLLPAVGDRVCRPMLSFSGDDRRLAAVSHGTVSVWDLVERRRTALIETETRGPLDIALSPDGSSLAVAGYRKLRLWDLSTAE